MLSTNTKIALILLVSILSSCCHGQTSARDNGGPPVVDPIDPEVAKNFRELFRKNETLVVKEDDPPPNVTRIEVLHRVLKNPLVLDAIGKVEMKIRNFTKGVKLNLRQFVEDANTGFGPDTMIKLRNTVVAFIESMELSPLCMMSFVMMKRALDNKERWPLKFWDSMELVPAGIMEGLMSSFGQYDECLHIENNEFKGMKMRGQYCLAKFPLAYLHPSTDGNITNPYNLSNELLKLVQAVNLMQKSYYRFGICIPSTCTPKEVHRAYTKIFAPLKQKTIVEFEKECKTLNMEVKKNGYQRTAQSILVTLVLLVVMSTSIELYYKLKGKTFGRRKVLKKSLLVFSALSNTKLLFKRDPKRLNIVDTILCIFISLEFLGRTYIMPVVYGFIGIQRASKGLPRQYFKDKKFFWMRNSSYSFTIFVLMSSIVLGYKLAAYRGKTKYGVVAYLKYLLNRYLSLLRRIIGPLLLIYLAPLWGDGPIWHYMEPVHAKPCKDNLLAQLFFFNNYMPGLTHVCNLPSATFSAIFQYQVFAPVIMLLLTVKRQWFGYATIVILILLGSTLSIARRVLFDFKIAPFEVTRMNSVPEIAHSFIYHQGSAEQNMATFIIGLVVGYWIYRRPGLKMIGRNLNLVLFLGFMSLPSIASYWGDSFKALEGNFSTANFLAWFFSGRLLWALGYGWVVFACSTGRAGYVNRVLGQWWGQPLARLIFGVYLNHITIISIRSLAIKNTYLLTHSYVFESVIVDYMIAIVVSYSLYLLIECPVYHLIKIISGHTVDDVIKAKAYDDNNAGSGRDYEENIEIKLFTGETTNNL